MSYLICELTYVNDQGQLALRPLTRHRHCRTMRRWRCRGRVAAMTSRSGSCS